MKFHKIFISLIFIIFLVGITCVSAENIDDVSELSTIDADDVASVDESLDDNIGVEESDVLADSNPTPVNNWNDLASAVGGSSGPDVVNIESNLTPGGQITINHDVTIVGSADTYIGGSSPSNAASYNDILFSSTGSGLHITLKNIKFQNCGGNTLMKFAGNGNYILENCTFENITATSTKQVVVHLNYGHCEIINCSFEKCSTSYGTLSNYHETNVNNVHMIVRNSTFKNNYANVEPGVINNCGHLTVYDSTFEDNSAAWWAGAIHTHTNANTTVVRSIFKDNLAGWNGGALCTYSYLRVVNSTFVGNNATTNRGGGAIFGFYQGSAPYIIVENCDFINNTGISGNGGAIIVASGTLIVDDSRFENNKANATNGGAISSGSSTTTINNCNFTNNYAYGRGGAIFAGSAGHLNVYNCQFVNNTASEGNDIAYHYTTKRTNKAFLSYDYNEFWGENNASGSIYAYNTQYLVVNNGTHNIFHDISEYVVPGEENTTNDTNGSSGNIIVPDSFNGDQLWNASLEGALGGTPLVVGDRIYVPNGQSIYCLNITNGNLLWNVSSSAGYFHELALHNGVLIAPCAWDKFYMFNPINGSEIQPDSNMYQASSYYAPAIDGNTIYVSSEYPYGASGNAWIAVVKLVDGVYTYTGSILDIAGVEYGSQALLSQPILNGGYLWVNTINGLMCVDLTTNASSIVLTDTVGKPVVGGNVIYVLTGDNHIVGVGSTGSVVTNITVNESLGVGSTLAISNDGSVLYTVCADGPIYAAETTDSVATFITKVNPVSSALTVGDDGYLYVGDDAGILWSIIKYYDEDTEMWTTVVSGVYNVSSPIKSIPIINNNIIYVGTTDKFYSLSYATGVIYSESTNEVLFLSNNQVYSKLQLLTSVNDEMLSESTSKVLSPKALVHADFQQGDTIYYLKEGTYTVKIVKVGGTKGATGPITYYNNIIIKPEGNDNVVIDFNEGTARFNIIYGDNITFENLKFTSSNPCTATDGFMNLYNDVQNVIFKNCTFENMTRNNGYIIYQFVGTNNLYIENCTFINCTAQYILYLVSGSTYLYNSTFVNCLSDNSIVPIGVSGSKFYTDKDVSFNVLTDLKLTLNNPGDIFAELIDEDGNHIYSSALKFIVDDGEPIAPTSFDKTTGLYRLSYTPTKSGELPVSISCDNVELSEVTPFNVIVVSDPELTINGTNSITYGDNVINVNATLKEDINNDNVTFTILQGSNVINSTTAVVTNGFASATFNNKLNAGSYTLSVSYTGSESYGSASDSKTLTVGKATPDITVTVNPIIYVGDEIIVTVTVPEDVKGYFEICNLANKNHNHAATAKQNVNIDNATVTLIFDDKLEVHEYWFWYVFRSSNGNYADKSISSIGNLDGAPTFRIIKYESIPQINVNDVCLGDNVSISISGLNESATGNITITIDDLEPVTIDVKETYNISTLGAGVHTVKVVYSGDDTFSANETSETFNVFTIALEKYDIDYNSDADVVAVLPAGAEGMLGIEIDGKDPISAPVVNGSATFKLSNLKPGNYTLHMVYQGTPVGLHADVNITVIPKITPVDDLNTVDNTISLDLPSDATGNLTITIDGNTTIVVPVVNGTAAYPVENLTAGVHEITVAYEGNYPSYTSTQSVNVAKGIPESKVNPPESITAGSAISLPITLPGDANGILLVDVDGKKYYADLVNGTANVDIAGLTAGDKVLTYKYLGDDKYAPFTANTTLKVTEPAKTPANPAKVNPVASKITAKKATFKKAKKTKKYSITLKAGKKAISKVKVTIKVGKKTYTAKTNAKGKATFNLKKLTKKGKYTAVIKFKGNKNYKASSKKVKITVK